jgi:hypothetical protein
MKMKLYHYLLILCLAFSSCSSKEELKIPSGIYSKEQMIRVLTKVYVVDAATEQHKFPSGINMPSDPRESYKKFIPEASYDDFKKSYDFYLEHPKELNEIYTDVLSEISRLQAIHIQK